MKKVALIMALVVGMAFVAVQAAPVTKQKTQTKQQTQSKQQVQNKRDGRQGKILGFLKSLNLTDQQKADAKRIFGQVRERIKAVRTDTKLTDAQKIAECKEIHKAAMAEFRSILTPQQQKKFDAAQKKMEQRRGEMRGKMGEIAKALNLTAEQKDKIKKIMASHKAELKALGENKKLTREQKMAQAKKIRAAIRAEIRSILTPQQQKKFDQMIEKMNRRLGEKTGQQRQPQTKSRSRA